MALSHPFSLDKRQNNELKKGWIFQPFQFLFTPHCLLWSEVGGKTKQNAATLTGQTYLWTCAEKFQWTKRSQSTTPSSWVPSRSDYILVFLVFFLLFFFCKAHLFEKVSAHLFDQLFVECDCCTCTDGARQEAERPPLWLNPMKQDKVWKPGALENRRLEWPVRIVRGGKAEQTNLGLKESLRAIKKWREMFCFLSSSSTFSSPTSSARACNAVWQCTVSKGTKPTKKCNNNDNVPLHLTQVLLTGMCEKPLQAETSKLGFFQRDPKEDENFNSKLFSYSEK